MGWLRVERTEVQQHTVQAERNGPPQGHVRRTMQALWLLHCGLTRAKAAHVARPGRATVQRDGERVLLFVEQEPGVFAVRDVTVGRTGGGRVEIRSGVQPGEKVVTTGSFRLKSEMKKTEMESD